VTLPIGARPPAAMERAAERPLGDDSADRKLRESARQLEGLFVQQLFKAMRETVPQQEGIVSGGAGEDIFTTLLDQHLAAETPTQWEGGLAQSIYRQLRGQLPAASSSQPIGPLSR
jgi:peptidoglycan hydrolase FlgJ